MADVATLPVEEDDGDEAKELREYPIPACVEFAHDYPRFNDLTVRIVRDGTREEIASATFNLEDDAGLLLLDWFVDEVVLRWAVEP